MDRNRAITDNPSTGNKNRVDLVKLDSLVVRRYSRKKRLPGNTLMRRHYYHSFQGLPGRALKYVSLLIGQ
ncbi:MAG TPA: hypothetical protein DCZ10_04755 [Pelotomaculum sp.]|nr:hypothetical protein [Pelotomaculum sp.]